MAALRNGSKCSHTTCMLRFFTVSRLALNPNLIFEIGSSLIKSYCQEDTYFDCMIGDLESEYPWRGRKDDNSMTLELHRKRNRF